MALLLMVITSIAHATTNSASLRPIMGIPAINIYLLEEGASSGYITKDFKNYEIGQTTEQCQLGFYPSVSISITDIDTVKEDGFCTLVSFHVSDAVAQQYKNGYQVILGSANVVSQAGKWACTTKGVKLHWVVFCHKNNIG